MSHKVEFVDSDKQPVELKAGDCLSEKLTIHNSPILFGCRIGICGTCAIEIVSEEGNLHERTYDEKEFLGTMAPGRDNVRLACQIHINANIKIKKTEI
jgi:ferredoxin